MRSDRLLLLLLLLPTLVLAQAGRVASRLTLRPPTAQTTVGTAATITVVLTDNRGKAVTTPEDITVQIRSPLLGAPMNVHIAPQTSSVSFPLIPSRTGPSRVEAFSRNLAPASMLVLANPSAEQLRNFRPVLPATAASSGKLGAIAHVNPNLVIHHPVEAVNGVPPAAGAPAPPPPPPVASVVLTPEIILAGDPQYDPDQHKWHATVVVGLHDPQNHYLPPGQNSSGRLFANLATIAPVDVAWDTTSPWSNNADLTSSQPGQDTLRLASALGSVESSVTYSLPPATQIVLSATPKVTNDGKVKVPLSVRLTDGEGNEAPAAADTEIHFQPSQGTVDPDRITIKAGKTVPDTSVTITSARNGDVNVRATGMNLRDGAINILFSFPIRLLLMASIGGIIGSLVRKPKSEGHLSLKHLLASAAVGIIVGVFFFIVAYVGALSVVPSFSIVAIDKVPSGNELGAALIGFIAGLGGVGIFLKDGGDKGNNGGAADGQLHRVDVSQPTPQPDHH